MSLNATLVTCLKDEGPFLIEWLAFHKAIGFNRFIVGANDCSDGSHEMLSRLAELGELEYLPFSKKDGFGPQETFAESLVEANIIAPGEWICWLDLDEFLNIHLGDGMVRDLLAVLQKVAGIRLNWRIFGASADQPWPGRQLHPSLCRCAPKDFGVVGPYPANRTFKSLYRYAKGMGLWGHGPIFNDEHIAEKPIWWRGNGKRIRKARWPYRVLELVSGTPGRSFLPGHPTYDWAQINHYATRHPDLTGLKRKRGRGGGWVPEDRNKIGADDFTHRHSDEYFLRYNRTDDEDRSILRQLPAVNKEIDRLLADETVQYWNKFSQALLNEILRSNQGSPE